MKLGQIETVLSLGHRDAFHMPAVLVACDETLRPGDSVKFVEGTWTKVVVCFPNERHGIIDPFIGMATIPAGRCVAMLLQPSLVDGKLYHNFEIVLPKAFKAEPTDEQKEHQDFTEEMDLRYGKGLWGASEYEDYTRCKREGC